VIAGSVGTEGSPVISLQIGDRQWRALVDTGFNGDLELPESIRPQLNARFIGRTRFLLAAGHIAVEDTFLVNFPFDGETILAEATFCSGDEILVGTGMLRKHRLEIHFPNRTVTLESVR
jgi:clan AA aspartic protease